MRYPVNFRLNIGCSLHGVQHDFWCWLAPEQPLGEVRNQWACAWGIPESDVALLDLDSTEAMKLVDLERSPSSLGWEWPKTTSYDSTLAQGGNLWSRRVLAVPAVSGCRVPHPSTNRALWRLTSEVDRDLKR